MPGASLHLLVKLTSTGTAELLRISRKRTEFVGDLKTAISTKFKLAVAPQELQLLKLDGSAGVLLDPAQPLSEAGIHSGVTVAVEHVTSIRASATIGA